jgi:hypothetical protein
MTSNFLTQAVMITLCYFDIGCLANMKRENKALANRIQVSLFARAWEKLW